MILSHRFRAAMRARVLPCGSCGTLRSVLFATAVGLASSVFVGCTPNVAYRTNIPDTNTYCIAGSPQACATSALYEVEQGADASTSAGAPVLMGVVEFDDQGYLFHPDLKDTLIERLRQTAQDHPLLIVVYAHGWKHNASGTDGDVAAFQNALLRIAKADHEVCARIRCARRQVVGVYLGWRGLSATVEPFKELSFWTRKSRAHRVGLDGATEVLADLAKIKSVANHTRGDEASQETRIVLAGHSFGGALLYTATEQLLMRDTAFPNKGSIPRSVADLVVLVNPAFEAARFHALESRAARMAFKKSQRPILAVFTSKTDTATKFAFPLGRSVSTLFERTTSPAQHDENTTALGHYVPFQTHGLLGAIPAGATAELPPLSSVLCSWHEFQFGESDEWDLGDVKLVRLERMRVDGQRQNPYMVVSVDGSLIQGHVGIWGDAFSEFLYRFVAVQSMKSGDDCSGASEPQRIESSND